MTIIYSGPCATKIYRAAGLSALNIMTLLACLALLQLPANAAEDGAPTANGSESGMATDPIVRATEAHARALEANAPRYADKEWRKADKSWQRMVEARDDGKLEKAQELAIETLSLSRAAEQISIQVVVLADARAAIDSAVRNKASRYAPRTLEKARKLANRAEATLIRDNYDTTAAEIIANDATKTAIHAGQIAAIAAEKPTIEDVILRWESRLKQVQNAAGLEPAIDADAETAVTELADEVEHLRQRENQLALDLADSQAFNAALEEEIRDLDQRLGGASDERRQLMLRLEEQARIREQFLQAEALFGPEEAMVFRQSDDVVVRVIGLRFASGSPNLDAGNEELLIKLRQVVDLYPGSVIVVEGHTDSRGSDRINKRLSEQRAQAVANYFITEMQIPEHRLVAVGYGSDRPIANNETVAGREKNRRIDLVITPSNSAGL